jgi:hypothetical protein
MDLKYQSITAIKTQKMRARMQSSGVTLGGLPLWTEEEIAILREHWPNYSLLCERLPKRSRGAIHRYCSLLGIARKQPGYTGTEISKLRKLYPNAPKQQILEAVPGRSWISIGNAARKHRIHRRLPPYKQIGFMPFNVLLQKCQSIGWSLVDLDEECGTGNYFARGGWRNYKINMKNFSKALLVLDGTLEIKWKEYDD